MCHEKVCQPHHSEMEFDDRVAERRQEDRQLVHHPRILLWLSLSLCSSSQVSSTSKQGDVICHMGGLRGERGGLELNWREHWFREAMSRIASVSPWQGDAWLVTWNWNWHPGIDVNTRSFHRKERWAVTQAQMIDKRVWAKETQVWAISLQRRKSLSHSADPKSTIHIILWLRG